MARVLHIIDGSTPRDMLGQLSALAGTEAVACLGPRPDDPQFTLPVRATHKPLNLESLAGLRIAPLARDAAILHCWSMPAFWAARVAADRCGARIVLSLPHMPRGPLWDLPRQTAAGDIHLTVPTEAALRAMTADGFSETVLHVLPPACAGVPRDAASRPAAREQLGIANDDLLLIAPGELLRDAGHTFVIWAHAILRQIIPNISLLIPEDGPVVTHVKFFAGTTGYDSQIHMPHGRVSLEQCFAAADVAAFVPVADCGVGPLAAAMAAGVPLVATRTPDNREMTADGEAAELIVPGDPRQTTAALLRLIDNPARARQLAQKAQSLAAQRFAPGTVQKQLARVYAAACPEFSRT